MDTKSQLVAARPAPGSQIEVAGTTYTVAPCGALVRLTPKLKGLGHKQSQQRRAVKGKF